MPFIVISQLLGENITAQGVDFGAYYLTGLRVRHGLGIYDWGQLTGQVTPVVAKKFLYPPIVAIGFVPFTFVSFELARWLWILLQLLFLCGGVLAVFYAAGYRLSVANSVLVSWLVVGFQPVLFLLRIGNITGVIAGLLCFAAAMTILGQRNYPYLAGALTTLSAVPKPFVLAAGAHVLWNRRRFIGAVIGGFGIVLASVAVFGVDPHREYLTILVRNWHGSAEQIEVIPIRYDPFYRFPQLKGLLQVIILLIVTITAIITRVGTVSKRLDMTVFALGIITIPLVAPSATTLTLVIAIPGLLVAGIAEWRAPTGQPSIIIGAVFLIQLSEYGARWLNFYGYWYFPGIAWTDLGSWLYVLQPATLGLLGVFSFLVIRAWQLRFGFPAESG